MAEGVLLLNAGFKVQEMDNHLDFLQLLLVVGVHLLKALFQLMVSLQQGFAKLRSQM